MPPIGNQSYGELPVLQFPNGDLVVLPGQVAQWPRPNTNRIDGKLRWISEPLLRPIASRYIAQTQYSNASGTEFRSQYFWFDIEHTGPGLVFTGTTGQNGDTSFDFEIGHVNNLTLASGPGVYVLITNRMTGAPTLTEYHEIPDTGFGWPYDSFWERYILTPADPTTWPFHLGDPWPIRWCRWWPVSECFPVGDLEVQEFDVIYNGAIDITTPGQVVTSGTVIQWEDEVYQESSPLWSASDPTKLVIPSAYNLVRFLVQMRISSGTQSWSLRMDKNGSDWNLQPKVQMSSGSVAADRGNQLVTPWLQVEEGDEFRVLVSTSPAATVNPQAGNVVMLSWEAQLSSL